ncbi:hypothetical protein PbDSM24746_26380 [Paenibacillus macerans]|nr:hypothetical protein PbDSM24746_26380 [Paenibacillus macerans]GBK68946.1 hypothetical protein PbJCM17693_26540 [Paenibacillus macerans]
MARMAVKTIMDKVANPSRHIGRVLVHGKIIYRDSVKTINKQFF